MQLILILIPLVYMFGFGYWVGRQKGKEEGVKIALNLLNAVDPKALNELMEKAKRELGD